MPFTNMEIIKALNINEIAKCPHCDMVGKVVYIGKTTLKGKTVSTYNLQLPLGYISPNHLECKRL